MIHVGGGDWLVVDSHRDGESKRAVALAYLEAMGIDPATAIRLIVATHWHDDHIRGIGETLRAAPAAKFACAASLDTKEFFRLVASGPSILSVSPRCPSGVDEFREVLEVLETQSELACPEYAKEGTLLFRRDATVPRVIVQALSPSSASLSLSFREIAQLRPEAGQQRAFRSQGPNDRAVVLWVEAGDQFVLLGADLENSGHSALGWSAVLSSTTLPPGKADILKVAHHGSHNADNPGVWTRLLVDQPIGVLTPFSRGRVPLPRPSDVTRMLTRTTELFSTARPGGSPPPKRPAAVEKTIREIAKDRRAVVGQLGHIRIRAPLFNTLRERPTVELFGAAMKLKAA